MPYFMIWEEQDDPTYAVRVGHDTFIGAAEKRAEQIYSEEPYRDSLVFLVNCGETTRRIRVYVETEPVFDGRYEEHDGAAR